MPYDIENPPGRIDALPDEAKAIWVEAFNSAFGQHEGDETSANKIAWAAVKQEYHQDNGGWVANTCDIINMDPLFGTNSIKVEPVGQDEHFNMYKVSLTGVGVMRRGYKSPDEVRKIPKNTPKIMPLKDMVSVTNEHPPVSMMRNYLNGGNLDGFECGFVSDIHVEEDPDRDDRPLVIGIDHVPRSRPDIIELIENGGLKGVSIDFLRDKNNTSGEWNGYPYEVEEKNIRIVNLARLFKEPPACPPTWPDGSPGCGHTNNDALDSDLEPPTAQEPGGGHGEIMTTKTTEKPVGVSDMSIEAIAEVNPAVNTLIKNSEELKTKFDEMSKTVDGLKKNSDALEAIQKEALEAERNALKELKNEDFPDDKVDEMDLVVVQNVMKALKKNTEGGPPKPPATVKHIAMAPTQNTQQSDEQWWKDHNQRNGADPLYDSKGHMIKEA